VGAHQIHPHKHWGRLPRKKIEDLMNVRGIDEKSFLKLKAMITGRRGEGRASQQQ